MVTSSVRSRRFDPHQAADTAGEAASGMTAPAAELHALYPALQNLGAELASLLPQALRRLAEAG
jgi:hypothetical protein